MTTKTGIHTAQCKRCGRTLTDPKSVAAKLGPVCTKKRAAEQRAAAVIAKHQPAQVDKAIELIGDAGILPTSSVRAGVFTVVSSNGVDRYTTTPTRCTCPAGTHGRTCYHLVAAELMFAAA
jgi:hypothetical protein